MEYPSFVSGQIYLLTNITTWKQYVGQARSHYRNRAEWVPAGYQKRWISHINEAKREYRHESVLLNRSIRKYGDQVFDVELIHICPVHEMDMWEIYFIDMLDTYKFGLNLTPGGKCGQQKETIRIQIANKLMLHYDNERISALEGKEILNAKISRITSCGLDLASITFRTTDKQNLKVDFGGKLQNFEDSLKRCVKFALLATSEEKLIVQNCLREKVNLPKAMLDDRLEQNSIAQRKNVDKRYESLITLNIDTIRIERSISAGKDMVTMVIICGTTKKYVRFGGKLVKFDESFNNAVSLSLRLVNKDKIILQQGLQPI